MADPSVAAEDSWHVRASNTAPEAPAPGADVFDVYSRSEARALDGTRYREW
jgi:general secretion pathway protein G